MLWHLIFRMTRCLNISVGNDKTFLGFLSRGVSYYTYTHTSTSTNTSTQHSFAVWCDVRAFHCSSIHSTTLYSFRVLSGTLTVTFSLCVVRSSARSLGFHTICTHCNSICCCCWFLLWLKWDVCVREDQHISFTDLSIAPCVTPYFAMICYSILLFGRSVVVRWLLSNVIIIFPSALEMFRISFCFQFIRFFFFVFHFFGRGYFNVVYKSYLFLI